MSTNNAQMSKTKQLTFRIWWDAKIKSWTVIELDAKGNQIGDAQYYANKESLGHTWEFIKGYGGRCLMNRRLRVRFWKDPDDPTLWRTAQVPSNVEILRQFMEANDLTRKRTAELLGMPLNASGGYSNSTLDGWLRNARSCPRWPLELLQLKLKLMPDLPEGWLL